MRPVSEVPARRTGADVERLSCLRQSFGRRREASLAIVTPVEDRDVTRQVGEQLRVSSHGVAPDLDRSTVSRSDVVNVTHEVEPDARPSETFDCLSRFAESEVVGLVAADVELRAREIRQQLVVQAVEKLQTFDRGRERERKFRDLPPRELDAPVGLGEWAVAIVREPPLEVAEVF